MPITPAHAVVAIPLRRLGLPVGALAIGSMVPDVAVFLPRVFPYDLTHSARGVVTVDLVVGLVALLAWWRWLREPTIDLLPRGLRERIPMNSRRGGRAGWFRARVLAALLLGGATHVLWDSFTHDAGRTAAWLPILERDWGPWPGYQWLQVGSGVVGLVTILAWWGSAWRQAPPVRRSAGSTGERAVRWLVLIGMAVAGVVVAVVLLRLRENVWWVTALRVLLRGAVLGGVVGLVAGVAWWHLRPGTTGSCPPQTEDAATTMVT